MPEIVLSAVVNAMHYLEVPSKAMGLLGGWNRLDSFQALVVVLYLLLALLLEASHVELSLNVFDFTHCCIRAEKN